MVNTGYKQALKVYGDTPPPCLCLERMEKLPKKVFS